MLRKTSTFIFMVLMVFAVFTAGKAQYFKANPETAYEYIVGNKIESGIKIEKYTFALNDNLFHVSHYFKLNHEPSALTRFLQNHRLIQSYDDAIWYTNDISTVFDEEIKKEDVVEGYENDSPRNDWLLVLNGYTTSYFVFN